MALKTNLTQLTPAKERFSRKVPLLSGGLINPKYFPDGDITVYPWGHETDDWITTKVRKGQSKALLFAILPKVVNLNGCPVEAFAASETLGLLMIARSILHDDVISFTATCPKCNTEESNKVKIPDDLSKHGEKKAGWPGYDEVTLPNSKDVVRLRVLTIDDEMAVINKPQVERPGNCSDIVARLLSGIVSVGGGKPDNVTELISWFNALPPSDQSYLLEQFDEVQPHLSPNIGLACGECGKHYEHSLRLDVEFFR